MILILTLDFEEYFTKWTKTTLRNQVSETINGGKSSMNLISFTLVRDHL